jgi:hypothetical protein
MWIWWIGSWCLGVWYDVLGWYYVQLLPTCPDERDKCASGSPWSWYQWNGQSAQCNLTTFAGYALHAGVISPMSSFTGRRKLAIFFVGRPTDLCLDSIRLMSLKILLRKGRKATEVGFSGVVASPSLDRQPVGSIGHHSHFRLKVSVRNSSLSWSLSWSHGSGPMYQRGKHSLLVGRVLVRVGMEIEVGVCAFMAQRAIVFTIYINI